RKVGKTKRLSKITFNEFSNKPTTVGSTKIPLGKYDTTLQKKHKNELMKSEYDGRKTTVPYGKAKYLLKELREENPKLIL
ncbi:MAG: hypothetical protein COZ07_07180, partial [Candidatus Infernicultor aquiphilus]